MKKIILVGVVLIFTILISGCSKSPADKLEKLEKNKEKLKETSGYNACIAKIEEKVKAEEDCEIAKLAEKGYTDGLDCVGTFSENPICEDTARYNAEVNSSNDCMDVGKEITSLTQFDCLNLLLEDGENK